MKVFFDDVNLESLNFFVEEEDVGLMPKTVDAIIESDELVGSFDLGAGFEGREFQLRGHLVCDTLAEQKTAIRTLALLFRYDGPKALNFIPDDEPTPSADSRTLFCYVNGDIEISLFPLATEISIPLYSPDPFWYSYTENSTSIEEHVTPAIPIEYEEPTPIEGCIFNMGNFISYPIIEITGPITNPWVLIGAELMQYIGSLTDLDTLIFNNQDKTITMNGVNALKDSTKVFPGLEAGNNGVYSSDCPATIKWRDCWL